MSKTIGYVTDRSFLRFPDEAKTQFAFLETQGFHCVHSEATLVRFESSRLAINIYHGRQSYEIGLEIESLVSPTDRYSFSTLLHLIDQELAKHYRSFSAHSVQGVSDGVRQLAESLKRCLAVDILNDKQLFPRLKLQCQKLREDYALEVQLQQARGKAEVAWRNKDYAAVVRNLKPLRSILSVTEIEKLEFAEKKKIPDGGK